MFCFHFRIPFNLILHMRVICCVEWWQLSVFDFHTFLHCVTSDFDCRKDSLKITLTAQTSSRLLIFTREKPEATTFWHGVTSFGGMERTPKNSLCYSSIDPLWRRICGPESDDSADLQFAQKLFLSLSIFLFSHSVDFSLLWLLLDLYFSIVECFCLLHSCFFTFS